MVQTSKNALGRNPGTRSVRKLRLDAIMGITACFGSNQLNSKCTSMEWKSIPMKVAVRSRESIPGCPGLTDFFNSRYPGMKRVNFPENSGMGA